MRYYEKRQHEMLERLRRWFLNHGEKTFKRVPALRSLTGDLIKRIEDVNAGILKGVRPIRVSTMNKSLVRKALIAHIFKLSGILQAYRFQRGVTAKKGKAASSPVFSLTMTDLNRATADDLYKISGDVVMAVKKIKSPHLYGLTADDITDGEAYIKEFGLVRNSPKLNKKETSKRNTSISAGIKECMTILENTIDPLMRIAIKDDQRLEISYKSNRNVMPKGSGRKTNEEIAYRRSRTRKPKKDTGS